MADVDIEIGTDTNGLNKTEPELNGDSAVTDQTAIELLEETKNGEVEHAEDNGELDQDNGEVEPETDKESTPQKSIRRSGRRTTKTPEVTKSAASKKKAEEDDEEMEVDETQPTPKRRISSRVKAPVQKLETPEVANVKRTPAPTRKRNAESDSRNVKTAKQKRLTGTPVVKRDILESDDPFSFDQNADQHPEPLKNIQMEKGAFGEVKFTKTPTQSSASKYANTEKTASERRGNLPTSIEARRSQSADLKAETITALSPVVRRELDASAVGSTSKKSAPRTKRRTTSDKDGSRASESTFDMDVTQEDQKPTPRSQKRKSVQEVIQPKKEEELFVPTLTPEQQREVDHPQSHASLSNGARVFALWSNDYYPAIVCSRDGLSRYRVLFVEDNFHRDIPPTGVIPLAALPVGQNVVIVSGDDEYATGNGEIIALPSAENAEEWAEGLFEVRREDSKNVEKISWQKLYLNKKQAIELTKQIKNKAVLVSEENIVVETGKRRSSARNRSMDVTQEVKTPTIKTPATARKQTPQSRSIKKTPKESKNEELTPKNLSFGPSPVKEKFATPKSKSPQKEAATDELGDESAIVTSDANTSGIKPTAIVTPNNNSIDVQTSSDAVPVNDNIFNNMKFVLTSANRQQRFPDAPVFNKRECRGLIEERGGAVIDDFKDYNEGDNFFLIADTYYRTQKYLSALSLSIPCVDHKWISECVSQNALLDHTDYMLPAGESTITERVYPWKPLKGILLAGKKVCVYSRQTYDDKRILGFVNIWTPIIKNLGATLMTMPDNADARSNFISTGNIDILLTDPACESELVTSVEKAQGIVVSSEWVIQSIIAGEPVDVNASDRFRYDVA